MSVFTNLFLLTTCLPLMINGAPNKNSDEGNVRFRDSLRPRQNDLAIPNLDSHTGSAAFPSGLPPLSNGFAMGKSPLIVPSGTANTGASSGNGGYQPFPTEGAPYQNYTSANGQPASYPFAAGPTSQPAAALSIESAANQIGQSTLANQYPSPETVTLPPQTVTLPAQTVTVTAAPQTVTITPQIQTQTVTVTITITAGPAPTCPSNAGSPQAPPVAAPSNLPPLGGLNASAAASVPPIPALPSKGGQGGQGTGNLGLGNRFPAQTGGQASGFLPAMPSGQASRPGTNAIAPYPTNIVATPAAPSVAPSAGPSARASAAPSAAPALPSIAALPSGSAIPSIPSAPANVPANSGPSPSNAGQESVPGAAPSAPPNGQAPAQALSPLGPARSGGTPIPVPSGNALGQSSGAAPVLPPSAPYQNATGPFNGTAPRGSGSSGTMPRVGPTASGFRGPIGGPTAPIRPPLPSGYSIQFPSFQANETKGALPSGLAGPTVPIILPPAVHGTPTPLPSASTSQKANGPNSLFHGMPAGPTPRPIPPVSESDVQGPELSSFSTAASCSPNNTMAQNITANVKFSTSTVRPINIANHAPV